MFWLFLTAMIKRKFFTLLFQYNQVRHFNLKFMMKQFSIKNL